MEMKCELCNGRLIKKAVKVIKGTKYQILKCDNCKHIIARHLEEGKNTKK